MPNLHQCLTWKDNHDWGGKVDTPDGPYYHHKHGSKVLGVAHLDTVMSARPIKDGKFVCCPQLDDRLGVYCLLDWLPRMGIQLDVLLTTGEEHCRSTAAHFQGEYNWIAEFDRAGNDVVFYQYHDDFAPWWSGRIGHGSYSDIVDMEALGVCAVNIGIGYQFQHTMECYADLRETEKQLKRFGKFFDRYCETRFPFTPPVYVDDWKPRRKHKRKHKRALVELPPRSESGHWWNERDEFEYDPWRKSNEEWQNWDELAKLHNEFN
jgi:hypothetical protein